MYIICTPHVLVVLICGFCIVIRSGEWPTIFYEERLFLLNKRCLVGENGKNISTFLSLCL